MPREVRRFSGDDWARFSVQLAQGGKGRTLNEFKEYLKQNVAGLDRHFQRQNWTLWEAYAWMCEDSPAPTMGRPTAEVKAERLEELAHVAEPSEDVPLPEPAVDKVKERVDEYLLFYKDASPNDISTLRDLAFSELNIERLNLLLTHEIDSGAPDSTTVKNYTDALARLSQQSRALQELLHIDRATRERMAEQSSDVDQALGIMEAAGEHVAQFGRDLIHVGCEKSGTIGKSDILMGVLLWDFLEVQYELKFICPRCGNEVALTHEPTKQQVEETARPEWVENEEGNSATE